MASSARGSCGALASRSRMSALVSDTHLRSTLAVAGYEIEASDGTVGRVIDFFVDDKTWTIQELVVEVGYWYSGKGILIPTNKIKSISYNESKIHGYLIRKDIELTGEHHVAHAHRH